MSELKLKLVLELEKLGGWGLRGERACGTKRGRSR